MNIWNQDSIRIFLLFVIPGFFMLTIYDLVISGPRRDFTKSLLQVICFSSINYALCSPLIIVCVGLNFYENHFSLFIVFWFFILVCAPVMLVIFYLWLVLNEYIDERFVHPIQSPWDWFFRKRDQEYWAIVHLKDGTKVGGKYGKKSFASSAPSGPQIYLEQVWRLDNQGRFLEAIDRSAGVLFTGDELLAIEFFK